VTLAAPFPYFGGKRRAAEIVWNALGDPSGYVEPFAGSAAILLARDLRGRRVETLNDADGWLVNAWRAIQHDPAAVAKHAYGPVTEIDYHARLAWLHERRTAELVQWLEGDPENHDAKAAGWWLYVLSCGIGDPFGGGPWKVIDGKLRDTRATQDGASIADSSKLPHLGNAGRGVNRELPHLGDAGRGALTAYLERLAHRLSRVRITCGSWERVVKPSVVRAGAGGDGSRSVFLDPPYTTSGDLYAHGCDTGSVSAAVQEWCRDADPSLRIVLAGYDDEHDALIERGWQRVAGKAGGGAGYSVRSDNGRREGLWLSPSCVSVSGQLGLLGAA
jgi:hypothetical protein